MLYVGTMIQQFDAYNITASFSSTEKSCPIILLQKKRFKIHEKTLIEKIKRTI